MASYDILIKKSVLKDLQHIPRSDVKRILEKIKSLGENPRPRGCEKLSGLERYRLRQGKFRIVYSIQDNELTVWVVKISHRKDVYR
jgi:mRNA interferase RelE/StbE